MLNLDVDAAVETPEVVAERIEHALPYKRTGELVAAPDCGMKYLPREIAFGKLQARARSPRDPAVYRVTNSTKPANIAAQASVGRRPTLRRGST